ncbi:MAG: DUF4260 domain-containing protein, partial [Gemmatimonadota bacterium]|nr:DUF4260 domain-containing protein [Gemmatimonadota bacterium]
VSNRPFPDRSMNAVEAPIRTWLRLEALVAAVAGLVVWAGLDGGWGWFCAFILLPDISMIGYLRGPRSGAALYNLVHSYALPLAIGLAGGVLDNRTLLLTGTLWLTHIGIDRVLGYGLKYPTGFRDTHLGTVGNRTLPVSLQRTGDHLVDLFANPDSAQQPSTR